MIGWDFVLVAQKTRSPPAPRNWSRVRFSATLSHLRGDVRKHWGWKQESNHLSNPCFDWLGLCSRSDYKHQTDENLNSNHDRWNHSVMSYATALRNIIFSNLATRWANAYIIAGGYVLRCLDMLVWEGSFSHAEKCNVVAQSSVFVVF